MRTYAIGAMIVGAMLLLAALFTVLDHHALRDDSRETMRRLPEWECPESDVSGSRWHLNYDNRSRVWGCCTIEGRCLWENGKWEQREKAEKSMTRCGSIRDMGR